jgi:archaellum biogenesis protein FlaJ (TadC family)
MARLRSWPVSWSCFLALVVDFLLFTGASVYHFYSVNRLVGIAFSVILIAVGLVCLVKTFRFAERKLHTGVRTPDRQKKIVAFLVAALFIVFCAFYVWILLIRFFQPFGEYLLYIDVRLMFIDFIGVTAWIVVRFARTYAKQV